MSRPAGLIEEQFLSLKKTAIFAGVSPSTVLRWEESGDFPLRRRLGPNRVGWVRQELESWVSSREVVCTPSTPDQKLDPREVASTSPASNQKRDPIKVANTSPALNPTNGPGEGQGDA